MALTKIEKQTLKLYGNDPNYRLAVDARNKIVAIRISDNSTVQITAMLSSGEYTKQIVAENGVKETIYCEAL